MNEDLTGRPRRVRPQLVGVAAALLLAATVLTGLYLGLHTRDRFEQISRDWDSFATQADTRGALLSRLRGDMGYGGIIHNFKNFVLRREQHYLDRLTIQFREFKSTLAEFRAAKPTPEEGRALNVIERTIGAYETNLKIAIEAARGQWPVNRTDQLVKIDDTEALAALQFLQRVWRTRREQSAAAIASSVREGRTLIDIGFAFLAGLAVVALTIFFLFFHLLRELRQAISDLTRELRERKAAELAARKLSRAVEQSPATIVITDTDGIIEYVNTKFCAVSGYAAEEVIGRTPSFLQSGATARSTYDELRRCITRGDEWRGIFHNRTKSGDTYVAETAILPLRDPDGIIRHFIGIGEDITDKARAQEQMQKAQKMEAVGMLASGVAHDFNNVLTTILGNVHLAKLTSGPASPIREELDDIDLAAKRARHMVREILAFARRQPGHIAQVPVASVIREVVQLVRASVPEAISLETKIDDETLTVAVDPTRLHQVLMNLCANAAEALAGQPGCITIATKREPASDDLVANAIANGQAPPTSDRVGITICDTGPGIPEDVRDQIFEPFFSTKPAGKGTGLGLAVVANLLGEMNGQISFSSERGRGTCFEIKLPTVEPVQHPDTSGDRTRTVGSDAPVLLIDDDAEVLRTCEKILVALGYAVDCRSDPIEAIEAFEAAPEEYRLVITDLVMPGMNGEEICRAVRTQRSDCPIVLISAFRPGTLDVSALQPMVFLEKPIEPATLASAIGGLLEHKGEPYPAETPAS